MTSPSKAKGSRAELAVARYMQTAGWPYAERSYGAGRTDDVGDITNTPGLVVEVKDAKRHELAAWLGELETEVANARAITGVLVVKRRLHTDPADWYAITRFGDWCQMAKDAGL
jgi:Holliday junction resolvase